MRSEGGTEDGGRRVPGVRVGRDDGGWGGLDRRGGRALYPLVRQLRTRLTEEEFVSAVGRMRPRGYRLAAAYDDEGGGGPVGAAGYRVYEMLAYGRILYDDDLVTAEDARSGGVGKALLGWLEGEAKAENCAGLHLDSGVQRARAHRFYFREGMGIRNFHFAKDL